MIYRALSWFIILFACFYGIGSYPLFDDNEGLYASVARNMLSSGQFIVPHLNGVPYLEKPPMLYWLMAGSMSIFGINEWAVRLIPALMFFATAAMMQRFLTRHTKSETAGFAAAIMMVTSLPLLAMGRMILCDMTMTCFLSAALMQFYDWYTSARKNHLLAFWAFLALAVLSKGFVAVILAGGSIGVFLLWQRATFNEARKIVSLPGILLFFIITAPWHIAAALQEPGFAWFYFINEHLYRFLNIREPHDYYTGPLWYYLPRVLGYLVPWAFCVWLFAAKDAAASTHVAAKRLLWSWLCFSLLFFSVSGGKANYYMIAGAPALIMLLAMQLENHIARNTRLARFVTCAGFILILILFGFSRFFCNSNSGEFYAGCQGASWPAIANSLLYVFIAMILCWRIPARWLPPLLGGSILLLLPLLISGVNLANGYVSQKKAADYLSSLTQGDVAIYQEFEELSSLAFYLEKPLIIIDSISNDLLYGQRQPASKPYFMTLSQWAAHKPAIPLVILRRRLFTVMDSLREKHVDIRHICILKQVARVAVIGQCEKGAP